MAKTMTAAGLLLAATAMTALLGPQSVALAEQPLIDAKYAPELPQGYTITQVAAQEAVGNAVAYVRSISKDSGYAGAIPSSDFQRVTIQWKSPVPETVLSLSRATISGVAVTVKATKFSQEDLLAAGERVFAAARAGAVPMPAVVHGTVDASGLVVEVPAGMQASETSGALTLAYTPIARMPVSVETGVAPSPTSRQDDSAPWYGGGMMRHPGFNPPGDNEPYLFCSTGFAVVTPAGNGRLLSAYHCNYHEDVPVTWARDWEDGTGAQDLTVGGADVLERRVNDTQLIDPVGGTAGWVHGGPWNASSTHSRYHLKVGGVGSPTYLEQVCTSGANSGEHCGKTVNDPQLIQWDCVIWSGPTGFTCNGWRASGPVGSVGTIGGDSGGPVYFQRGDGRVGARGIIYGGHGDVNCGPHRWDVSNCFRTVYFTDIERLQTQWDVDVEVTP